MSWGDAQFKLTPTGNFVGLFQRALQPTRILHRVLMVYVAVVVPIASFAMTWDEPPNMPQWQSGDLYATWAFMISGRAGYFFYPLVLYSMSCFLLALFRGEWATNQFLVRLGVYAGVLLSLHYSVLLTISLTEAADWPQALGVLPFIAIAAIAGGLFAVGTAQAIMLGIWALHHWVGLMGLVLTLVVLVILAVVMSLAVGRHEVSSALLMPFFLVFFVSLLFGPFWMFAAYLQLSIEIARRHWQGGQFRLSQMMLVFTWLAGYMAAYRAALDLAKAEYAKLPTDAPQDCYIATAAAHGHRRVVGSWEVILPSGQGMRVTRQLQVFKLGEIAICSFSPQIHRQMRWVYDRFGPPLASCLAHPLLADAAHLSLIPAEWATRLALSLCVSDVDKQLSRIYRGRPRLPLSTSLPNSTRSS